MDSIQGTKAAIKAITDKVDMGEAATVIESKLSLVRHALIYGAEELTFDEKNGLAFVIEDVMALASNVLEYAQLSDNYFFQLDNPNCYGPINAEDPLKDDELAEDYAEAMEESAAMYEWAAQQLAEGKEI